MFVSQHPYAFTYFLINLVEIDLPQECFSKTLRIFNEQFSVCTSKQTSLAIIKGVI